MNQTSDIAAGAWVVLCGCALGIAGCERPAPPDPGLEGVPAAPTNIPSGNNEADRADRTQAADPVVAVEAEGLRLFNAQTGSARPVPFGTLQANMLSVLAFRGAPGIGTLGECGAGPLDQASWPDGLSLYFQDGGFVGWALDGRAKGALTTAAGIGPGSTRRALEAAYTVTVELSTLGNEFSAGELFGILDGPGADARITAMWAGVSCNFR